MSRARRAASTALVLLLLVGCSSSRNRGTPAKADFVTAADRICDSHLKDMLTWLAPLPGRLRWRRLAVRDGGIYGIMARTIERLDALGQAPGPGADAFSGYLRTLKARAVLYRLTSMADLRHDRPFLRRLHRAVAEINDTGDAAAQRYGLHICGAGLRDLATKLA